MRTWLAMIFAALAALASPAHAAVPGSLPVGVCENTNTTGTDVTDVTLAGAYTGGYGTFGGQLSDGDEVPVSIVTGGGPSRKIGVAMGTYHTSGDHVTLDYDWSTDGVATPLDLGGTSRICVDWSPRYFSGALGKLGLDIVTVTDDAYDATGWNGSLRVPTKNAVRDKIETLQPHDTDLDTYAGITPSANVQSFLGAANYAGMRTQLGLVIGTNVQAWDADLDTYAGITPSANIQTLLGSANYSAARSNLGVAIGTDVQAYDADLTTWAGITPGSNVGTLLATFSSANARSAFTDESGTGVALFAGGALCGADPNADRLTFWDDSAGACDYLTPPTNFIINGTSATIRESIIFAASDEITNLTTGTNKIKFRMPYAFTVTDVRCSLSTAQTAGSVLTVDINESGTTIISTKLTFDNSEATTTTAATPRVISDSSLADDAEISLDIDQVGTAGAKGLKCALIGNQ